MIKKILLTILTVLFFTNVACASRLPNDATVAMINFGLRSKTIYYSEELNAISKCAPEFVRSCLLQDGRIKLMDKEAVNSKLQTANFLLSEKLDSDAIKIVGKELGCRYLLCGNVAFVTTRQELVNVHKKNNLLGCPSVIYIDTSVVLRIIDTETSKIVSAGIGKGCNGYYYRGEREAVKVGSNVVSKKAVEEAIREASMNAVDRLLKQSFSKDLYP